MKNQGIPAHHFEGKPVIGICNTWSELTPCNAHFRELAQKVKNGIYEAGGFPVEFPVMSTGETLIKPTAMLYRNLVSMDVEESIRANPLDGVVLLCGCDKTTPSLVMGACSVDIPTIVVSGGPMLTGKYRGTNISTSDLWRFSEAQRMGDITQKDMQEVEAGMCRSAGHCGVMGTASTMACMVESLGLSLPGNAAIPAVDSNRRVLAHHSGMRIVEMVKENLTLSKILTREAFENAIIVNTAIGGSTNFVLHLLAIAGRIGIDLSLDDMNNLAKDIPLLLNLQPSGEYFMEDFYYAGGLPAVLKELDKYLRGQVITVNGHTIKENFSMAKSYNDRVISPIDQPVNTVSGVAVLKGNLCPDGAVLKLSAASPELMKHKGQAIVFEDIDDYKNRINDPELPATADSILVLKQVGPVGYPGMPEVGNLGLPPKLLLEGVRDMVRISDGRMSGTGFGTCILHVSPESAVGGPLAIVRDGDWIELDVPARSLNLLLSQEEINERLANTPQFNGIVDRGYVRLHQKHVEQAHLGADLDFLKGGSGSKVTRDSH
jgi:dihydroxy-acid dehydratase